jgi:hypothetical protein
MANIFIIPILQWRKLKLRKLKGLVDQDAWNP